MDTDAGYSIDKLREEERARSQERAERERKIVSELGWIRVLLAVIAGLLLAIGYGSLR